MDTAKINTWLDSLQVGYRKDFVLDTEKAEEFADSLEMIVEAFPAWGFCYQIVAETDGRIRFQCALHDIDFTDPMGASLRKQMRPELIIKPTLIGQANDTHPTEHDD